MLMAHKTQENPVKPRKNQKNPAEASQTHSNLEKPSKTWSWNKKSSVFLFPAAASGEKEK